MLTIRFALYVAAALFFAALGWNAHNWIIYQPHLKADAKADTAVAAAVADASGKAFDAGIAARDAADDAAAKIQTVNIETIRKVPVYVTRTVSVTSSSGAAVRIPAAVPVGAGLLYNFAAAGVAPPSAAPAGLDLEADSGVGMSQLTETTVSNFGQCHTAIAEVRAWRSWYDDVLTPWWAAADQAIGKAGRR